MDLESAKTSDDADHVARTQNVSNESRKRPPEEPEGVADGEPKKCKIDVDDDNGPVEPLEVSKRRLKKLRKKQQWLNDKPKRRLINKMKKKEKQKLRAQLRESGAQINKVKPIKMAESSCKQRIVLDMSYDHLMSDKDLNKCSDQLLRCYSVNRRMKNPMQFYVSSYEGKFKEVLSKHNGAENWDIKYEASSFDKIFKNEEIVYLTSDSLNILNSLDESKVYIIGGLVDHNSCKGASLKIAENLGVAHAQLPIGEYINMKTRKVLTIFHVYEILSKVVAGMSWKESFISTIPKRKIFSAKDEEVSLDDSDCSSKGKGKYDDCPDIEEKEDYKGLNVVKEKNEYLDVEKNVNVTE